MTTPHLIQKVSLELQTGRLGDVNSLQEELSQRLWQQALPQIEQLFDQLVPPDEVVRLDQVVLNLPHLAPHDALEDFVPYLLATLERSLADYLAGYQPREITASQPPLSQAQSDGESFLYFLQYGRLPWWSPVASWESWLARWQTALQTDLTWQFALRSLLATHPVAISRLVTQFPAGFRHQLLLQLQPTWVGWRSLLQQSQQLAIAANLGDHVRTALDDQGWHLILTLISHSSPAQPLPQETWIRQWLPLWLSALGHSPLAPEPGVGDCPAVSGAGQSPTPIQPNRLHTLISTTLGDTASPWHSVLTSLLFQPAASTLSSDSSPIPNSPNAPTPPTAAPAETSAPQPAEPDPTEALLLSQEASLSEPSQPDETAATLTREQLLSLYQTTQVQPPPSPPPAPLPPRPLHPEELQTGLFIPHAGVVLLHPFLRPYFDDAGLLDGDRFQSAEMQQLAVYLLHFLATGQTDPPEYALVFPKLLCGWPLNDPLQPTALPLSALAEAENLLQVVINYWDVLKNTSPDGLREGFLQRPGKLTQTSDRDWKLQVEQQAIDILLGRLPWGISMVKLPWMDTLLTVEWI